MVDTLDFKHVQRTPNVCRRALLTRVRYQAETQFAATREHPCELLGWVAQLTRRQSDANDFVAQRHSLLQRNERFLLAQMAQETQNQRSTHSQFSLRGNTGAVQAVDDYFGVYSVSGMGLGIEEYFCMDNVVGMSPHQIRVRHVVEVLLGAQHHGAGVVDVEKTLQVFEHISATQRLHVGIGQRDAIALA